MAQEKELTTKQKIYDMAKRLFYKEGYQVSFPSIAKELGISQGLITYHFKTKRNLAIAIFKEDYEILSSHLKTVVNIDEDIFLFIISFYYLNDQILQKNPDKMRFLIDTNNENISIEAIYASDFKHIYEKLIEKMVPNELNADDNLTLFLTTTYSVYDSILQKISSGLNISKEYFFAYTIDLMFHCLGLEKDPQRTQRLIAQAKDRVDLLFKNHPELLDVYQYLID
ncbi:TetR/AcrR family transcriptional regulator [Eubacteriaceae bacterium ES3]|nr:TetR/AcrR family transcriptional regulator [Eubacteriaceae bacterium ES3]